jgi:hypothetical protein
MVQLSVETSMKNAYAGMLADTGFKHTVSLVSEEATSFPHGVALVRGTAEDQALLPTGAAKIRAIAQHSHSNEVGGDDANLIDDERVFNGLAVGRIHALVEEAIAIGDAVYVRVSAGTGTQLGAFRNDADTASCLLASGMRWVTAGDADNPPILEIDADAAIA